jgi:L-ascorbate metabolism protein UlaG (beta-lactamase superfamily)
MRHFGLIAGALLASILAATASAQVAREPLMEVCSVANAGFLVQSDKTLVLLDAIIGEGLEGYERPPDHINRRIENGLPPYRHPSIVFSSHKHGDHFNAAAIKRHMEHNLDTQYIMTPEARDALLLEGLEPDQVARIHAQMPLRPTKIDVRPEAETMVQEIGPADFGIDFEAVHDDNYDVDITLYNVDHGSEVQNLGIVIRMNGASVFHSGDMFGSEALLPAGLAGLKVDVALVPFWTLMAEDDAGRMAENIDALYIVPMHLPIGPEDWMDRFGGFDSVMEEVRTSLPNITMLDGERHCTAIFAEDLENRAD